MTSPTDASDALRKAAVIIQKLERRIELNALAQTQPIAIVGAGCRLPGGVVDLDSLWRVLSEGRDAVGPIPTDRLDLTAFYNSDASIPGTTYVRDAATIDQVDRFDAEFFGISPREAAWIDPQHRLLAECAYEALESAGIPPRQIRDTNAGVYVGLGPSDYAYLLGAGNDPRKLDGYLATGTGASFSAGRISYLLGLQGPAITLDTACSSSLTAVHLACRALRAGDCQLALAGGVQLMLATQPFVLLSRLHALSPDGRCKTFSERADGYGRGEGCGVIVLKLLSEALRDGDHIMGTIRGSAVNQDGASSGLTTPNGDAQRSVLRQALNDAHLVAKDIDYVEAHGTGTALGDPIEVEAIADVYGREREAPLEIGSIKTNIGHLESAAGIAGLLKVLCCLQHEALAPSLHAEVLSKHVDWAAMPVRVVRRLQAWPSRPSRPRRAGISAFGMSGTNAHVLLEEAPPVEPRQPTLARAAELIVLSAKTRGALSDVVTRLREHLEAHPEVGLGDLAHSLATTRASLEHRLALTTSSRTGLLEALAAAALGASPVGVQRGQGRRSGKLAWLFTGQGAQRLGMGRDLYAEWPVFREAFDVVTALFEPLLQIPLREVMWAEPGSTHATLLDQTGFTQPALFALEWALACLWRSWGVEPEMLLGHSIGGITAATVAGVFSLEDAAKLVAARAQLMQALPSGGAMASLAATEAQVNDALRPLTATVSLAAVNGPTSVVISGREADVAALSERFQKQGVQAKRLLVSHAFHSPLMQPMLAAFREVAASIRYHSPRIPIVSDTTGALAGAEIATPEYWVRHVRDTVRFASAVQVLGGSGADTFLELGPRPTLLGLVSACLPGEPSLLASIRPTRSEPEGVLDALGRWVAGGGSVAWKGVFSSGARRVRLPTYPWRRERHWVDSVEGPASSSSAPALSESALQRLASPGVLSDQARDALPEILRALSSERVEAERLRSLFYALRWQPSQLPAIASKTPGAWLVSGEPAEVEHLVAALLRIGVDARAVGNDLLAALDPGVEMPSGIALVDLAPMATSAERMLSIERALATRSGTPVRAWWLTRGAIGTSGTDPPTQPDQAVLWGLARTFALEHPRTWGGIIDLPSGVLDPGVARQIAKILTTPHGEDQLALRERAVFVPRIVLAPTPTRSSRELAPAKTALVTGGTGALGLKIAEWLARRGQKHLLLVSRSGERSAAVRQQVDRIRAMGAAVTVRAADVSDRDVMARVIRELPSGAPLGAVFHTAGLSDRTLLEELTDERFREILASKRDGTLVLGELTKDLELDAFVCFSSIAGVWGAGSQAAYAAANAFLDAWALSERAKGRNAFAISWGPWGGGGMADDAALVQLERRGLKPLDPERALMALDFVLQHTAPHSIVVDIDWEKFAPGFEVSRVRPLLNDVRSSRLDVIEQGDQQDHELKRLLEQLSAAERENYLCDWLAREVARVLSIADGAAVSLDIPFRALGMDSLMAVELRTTLSKRLGFSISAELGLDAAVSTTRTLARQLLPMIAAESSAVAFDIDLSAEAALPADIAPPGPLHTLEPTSVLLTGATGFLGAFLLSELLQQTKARVTCLVRAASVSEGLERVERNLAAYGLSSPAFTSRVSVLIGDLEKEALGLGEAEFRRLAGDIDAIYNNGAHVSFVAGYAELKPSHVDATREILRMASIGRPKAVHHVSSVASFDGAAYRGQPVSELTIPASHAGVRLPYSQCKWVSEAMVRKAGALGIPTTIHRPSLIGGATNGAWNTTDFLCRVLKGGAIEIGCLPDDIELLLDFSPVDFVARAIVYLSRQPGAEGKTFHLQHPEGILWSGVGEILRSLGYAIEPVAYTTWLQRLAEDAAKPIHPLLFYFKHRWPPENLTGLELASVGRRALFHSESTIRQLGQANIRCAPTDRELFRKYLERLAAVGFIPPPKT